MVEDWFLKMVKRLKCWRNVEKNKWINDRTPVRRDVIGVRKSRVSKGYLVILRSGLSAKPLAKGKTVKEARKKAITYMKKHDVCYKG